MPRKILLVVQNRYMYERFIRDYIRQFHPQDDFRIVVLEYYRYQERYLWKLSLEIGDVINMFSRFAMMEFFHIRGRMKKYDEVKIFQLLGRWPDRQYLFLLSLLHLCFAKAKKITYFFPSRKLSLRNTLRDFFFLLRDFFDYNFRITVLWRCQRAYFALNRGLLTGLLLPLLTFCSRGRKKQKTAIFISKTCLGTGIGDFISLTGLVVLLRKAYPDAFMVSEFPKGYGAITRYVPWVDRWMELKYGNLFGLAVTFFKSGILGNNFSRVMLIAYHKTPQSITCFVRGKGYYYDRDKTAEKSRLESYVEFLREELAIPPGQPAYPQLVARDPEGDLRGRFPFLDGRFVVLVPETRGRHRSWPEDNFARVGDALADRYSLKIVVTGTPGGKEAAARIASLMRNKPVNLAGKTTLDDLLGIIRKAFLVVSVDTSAWHVAQAFKRPAVVVTNCDLGGFYPVDTSICRFVKSAKEFPCQPPCWMKCIFSDDYSMCLKEVTPEDVIAACRELVEGRTLEPAGAG